MLEWQPIKPAKLFNSYIFVEDQVTTEKHSKSCPLGLSQYRHLRGRIFICSLERLLIAVRLRISIILILKFNPIKCPEGATYNSPRVEYAVFCIFQPWEQRIKRFFYPERVSQIEHTQSNLVQPFQGRLILFWWPRVANVKCNIPQPWAIVYNPFRVKLMQLLL